MLPGPLVSRSCGLDVRWHYLWLSWLGVLCCGVVGKLSVLFVGLCLAPVLAVVVGFGWSYGCL